ncbi:MAG: NUDIX domain-containing protein [Firmicutes bacterium]|nr:NUDIX domain-containing protein [Bacillota bacterium]
MRIDAAATEQERVAAVREVKGVRQPSGEEISAGGVVWHHGRVLVLRNFRDEYIFPKGHLEPGETAEQAALREVAEEAGLLATIVSPLPDTTYSYQKVGGGWQNKRVHWYNMRVATDQVKVDGVEIKWGAFLPPEEVAGRLTHALDRYLLEQSLAMMQDHAN